MKALLLQANINHSARAQDLLMQHLAEWNIDLAVVAEPYRVLQKDNWMGDKVGLVTIIGKAERGALPLSLMGKGEGFVLVKWGEAIVVGVYFSPNRDLAQFEEYLGRLADEIDRHLPGKVLVMGDLNAKSDAWGSPVTNARGKVLEEWGAQPF
ncbi:uncharacterized protein LOC114937420 [Nylanderia fulva]|uniref:uncharacterized protein LOC114928245 n=1 Tax=Nylanderia fulva TaxID=613905 RepID=UPI0010FAFABD|nr:uncharacterized protein LOC114928245 [Nylanderia fulva]XP_029166697.1 uncharacterized protein LOC114937420 [Nylanderia fulva]